MQGQSTIVHKICQLFGMLSQPRECIVNGPMASETLVRNLLFHHSIQIKGDSKVACDTVVIDKVCILEVQLVQVVTEECEM